MSTATSTFENDEQRRQAVAWAVALASTFSPVSHPYERQLTLRQERGELTAEQVRELLATAGIYQVLYRSHAAHPLSRHDLLELLEEARHYNAQYQLTGVLLYSEGRFVQVLEGPVHTIRPLYERIKQDARHHKVETVCEGPLPARQFKDWSMDFGVAAKPSTGQALPGLSITSTHIKQLLEVFIG